MKLFDGLATLVAFLLEQIHNGLSSVLPDGSGWAWGGSIVLLTITVRIILFPLFVKQIKSQRRMQEIAPKVKALQAKHKGDRETLNTELMSMTASPKVYGIARFTSAMTSPPLLWTASIAAGSTFTSVPRDTVPLRGGLVVTSTTSGGVEVRSIAGTRLSRHGRYSRPGRPRIPAPMKGVSRTTPSRSGRPGAAFSTNSRYAGSASSTRRSTVQGVAPLPPATTRGMVGRRAARWRLRASSETTRTL